MVNIEQHVKVQRVLQVYQIYMHYSGGGHEKHSMTSLISFCLFFKSLTDASSPPPVTSCRPVGGWGYSVLVRSCKKEVKCMKQSKWLLRKVTMEAAQPPE
ncbi:hypothetical protein ATANTOWER_031729 [Ataeniobius toweri]|uniref:Uncharacterized protein n=1 Tax=Ataeniobius toweri TaxID=208326 RepID=A0ABU7A918_9TELE|nr:hypothetical protein [Ataeniobius toweri]